MKTKKFGLATVPKLLSLFVVAMVMLLSASAPNKANAAGLLIADGGFGGVLEIKEHDVHVSINNGVAVTEVTQIFQNTENRQVEALYTFPVPKGASVANFSMWINGKEMVGEVLEKQRAREIYNSYKKQRRDPGLLEQNDYKSFEMRIFPINAGAEQKVQISYYQELNVDHDEATYVYPLATATRPGIDSRTKGKFAINIEVKSAIPIVDINSPSHGNDFIIAKHSDSYCQASLETTGGNLANDVVLNYDIARPKTGIDMITSKTPGEDGYFCMTITAGKELEALDAGMDYVFLLDISGSMGNDSKLIISRNSLEAFINELGPQDKFEVMTFNVTPDTLFGELRLADDGQKANATTYMASQRARGGTVLAPAMNTAYKYANPDRTLNVVILSDGMTEQKERRELLSLIQARPRNARVFCIGIGNEVNRPLLEQMAEDSGGLAAFISHGDNFQRAAKGFRRKLMRPVAADLAVDIKGLRVYDIVPKTLPNLYYGSPIRIYGRYAGDGNAEIAISANVQGMEMKQTAALNFPKQNLDNPEIERMWAWKQIDQLLKQADRTGSRDGVLDEVILLGEGYSIVTEYTSFIVLENDAEYKRWKIDRKNLTRMERDRQAQNKRQEVLDKIRNKSVADIGPQQNIAKKTNTSAPAPATSTPNQAQPRPNPGNGFDLNVGGGPVGPLFVGFVAWLRFRRKQR